MNFADHLTLWRNALINTDYVPAIEAEKFINHMRETHPDDLDEWMETNAVRFAVRAFGEATRGERNRARHRAGARAFAEAVANGETAELIYGHFRCEYTIDANKTRRTVAEMTGQDHRYVAASYREETKPLQMLAAFHLAVAKKCGTKKTREVMDEETYDRLLRSFIDKAA